MGIPKFYRWLSTRYPYIASAVTSDDVPPIDNLYLDLNGLVHNVTHANGSDKLILTSRLINTGRIDQVWRSLFKAFDDIVRFVRPRKVLFVALDSVPPVAKMVQQRSRRIKDEKSIAGTSYLAQRHREAEVFDISAISPGTQFMAELNKQLDFFLQSKVNSDPLYQGLRVIFSDSNTPGEGEQKITEYIRNYRGSQEYDANTRHCIYGLDADLIMLSLITHEPHMVLLKDVVEQSHSSGKEVFSIPRNNPLKQQEYILVFISVLREYFEVEFGGLKSQLQFPFDLERVIDDFVFFCFFVGNDFLPTLNTIDINYGSLDEVIRLYKRMLPGLGGYITDNGRILWENAERVFEELGKSEIKTIARRFKQKEHAEAFKLTGNKKANIKHVLPEDKPKSDNDAESDPRKSLEDAIRKDLAQELIPDTEEVAKAENDLENNDVLQPTEELSSQQGKARQLYYFKKFSIDIATEEGQKTLTEIRSKYMQGLQWVLCYYHEGVKHWGWFYCYHYAPLISDIGSTKGYDFDKSLLELKEPNAPLEPFEQLLVILPKFSRRLLPKQYHGLYDSGSAISDLYPTTFEVDPNGRELAWEAVKLIPCIDVCRILKAKNEHVAGLGEFTEEEKERNKLHKPFEYAYVESKETVVVKSPLKHASDLVNVHCERREFNYASVKKSFAPTLAEGVELPCYDFPSLKYINIESCEVYPIKDRGVLFDMIVLNISDCAMQERDFKSLIGKTIYTEYPYQREAVVTSLATRTYDLVEKFNPRKNRSEVVRVSANNSQLIDNAIENLHYQGLKTSARGGIKFLCYYVPMVGIARNEHERTLFSKSYQEEESFCQSPLIMLKRDGRSYLECDSWLRSQGLQYPMSAPCMILSGKEAGSTGVITDNTRRGQVKVQINKEVTNIKKLSRDYAEDKQVFMSMGQIAARLHVSRSTVNKLLTCVKVRLVDEKVKRVFNVAFSLIHHMLKLHVPFYTRYNKHKNDWAMNSDVVKYLEEYGRRCPHAFSVLENESADKNERAILYSDALFPDSQNPDTDIEKLFDWVLSLPMSSLPYIPTNTSMLAASLYTQLQSPKAQAATRGANYAAAKDLREVFVERRPFWTEPAGEECAPGDWVAAAESSGTEFGAVGMVLAANGEKAVVEFDGEALTGENFINEKSNSRSVVVDTKTLLILSRSKKIDKRGNYKKANNPVNYEAQYQNQYYYPQSYYNHPYYQGYYQQAYNYGSSYYGKNTYAQREYGSNKQVHDKGEEIKEKVSSAQVEEQPKVEESLKEENKADSVETKQSVEEIKSTREEDSASKDTRKNEGNRYRARRDYYKKNFYYRKKEP